MALFVFKILNFLQFLQKTPKWDGLMDGPGGWIGETWKELILFYLQGQLAEVVQVLVYEETPKPPQVSLQLPLDAHSDHTLLHVFPDAFVVAVATLARVDATIKPLVQINCPLTTPIL
jgi:hypothetical protein